MMGRETLTSPKLTTRPKPFLKWAGGKGQLLPDLLTRLPKSFRSYHEPFVGGGALFYALTGQGCLRTASLSDVNEPLVETYLALKSDVERVIAALRRHKNDRDYYYQVRARNPKRLSLPGRAARVIYLNKTCYNGLYRENRSGQFNVPFGRYKNPRICDESNLRIVAQVLQGVSIKCCSFTSVLNRAKSGDLVYFDPPYHPLSVTASFTSYDRNGFGPDRQVVLRDTLAALDKKGVHVMLSNSDTKFVREMYAGFNIQKVYAARAINSRADRRGKITELVIRNYT